MGRALGAPKRYLAKLIENPARDLFFEWDEELDAQWEKGEHPIQIHERTGIWPDRKEVPYPVEGEDAKKAREKAE